MENFVVSARKYRPQTFDTVVGQEHITTTLKNAIKNNQLAHAFLFCGPRGVGKTTCARILAKTINCENRREDGEACNECTSCKSFNEGTSLNIHELDAASNNSVDDIRTLVEQVRFAPQAGKYKVYIVDEVHMLSSSAFNAFLKTLEEPPHYAIFILATTEKHKILPTILSRCQIFDFKRITNKDAVDHLQEIIDKESINADKSALQVIAEKSEGCMRDALSILDKIVSFANGKVTYQNTLEHLNILDHDYYFKLLESLLQQDLASAMLLFDEVNKKGFEGDIFLNGFAEFIRNLMVCKNPKAIQLLDVVETMHSKYEKVAHDVSLSFLLSTLNILNEAEINYKTARNKRLHVELALMKLNYLQQAIELSTDNASSIVKKKRVNDVVSIRQIKALSIPLSQEKHTTTAKAKSTHTTKDFGEAKLYIEKNAENKTVFIPQNPVNTPVHQVVETPSAPVKQPEPIDKKQSLMSVPKTNVHEQNANSNISKKNLLETLRQKYQDEYNIEEIKEAQQLEISKLKSVWDTFTESIAKNGLTSSANAFKLSQLEILSENEFHVNVNNEISSGFISRHRADIAHEVQTAFANRSIKFKINIMKTNTNVVRQVTKEDRLEKIINSNPLVQELMERLKLNYK